MKDALKDELQKKGYTLHSSTNTDDEEMVDWAVEPILEGTYVSKEENRGTNKNQNIYHVKKTDGVTVKFWGSTMLNDIFSGIETGSLVYIAYGGKKSTKDGSNKYKYFDVLSRKPDEQ